jgi:hypothetical protein
VVDEHGSVMGVLTVCSSDRVSVCGGCTAPLDGARFDGQTNLSKSLWLLHERGFSELDLCDDRGELSARLDLDELISMLRDGGMPEIVHATSIPGSVLPRVLRILISIVAVPLIAVGALAASVPMMLVLLPLAVLAAPFLFLFTLGACVGCKEEWTHESGGLATEIPVAIEEETIMIADGGEEGPIRYRVRISDTPAEPLRIRVRVSPIPGELAPAAESEEVGVLDQDPATTTAAE